MITMHLTLLHVELYLEWYGITRGRRWLDWVKYGPELLMWAGPLHLILKWKEEDNVAISKESACERAG